MDFRSRANTVHPLTPRHGRGPGLAWPNEAREEQATTTTHSTHWHSTEAYNGREARVGVEEVDGRVALHVQHLVEAELVLRGAVLGEVEVLHGTVPAAHAIM